MKLFWIDLETTGLLPTKDRILEAAMVEADFSDPFRIDPSTVVRGVVAFTPGPEQPLDEFIVNMHTKNGLLAECAASKVSLAELEQRLMERVPVIDDKDQMPTIAGSSIHFDMAFLRVHMPSLARRFSHRLYDVSAIKLYCQSLGMPKFKKAEAHRALDDIIESATHGKQCTDWLRENLRK